jgi:hypothetical protein
MCDDVMMPLPHSTMQDFVTILFYGLPIVDRKLFNALDAKIHRVRVDWRLRRARLVFIVDRPEIPTREANEEYDLVLSESVRILSESARIYSDRSLYRGLEIATTPRHLGPVGALKYYKAHRKSAVHAVVRNDGVEVFHGSNSSRTEDRTLESGSLPELIGFFDVLGDDDIKLPIDIILILKLLLCDDEVNYVRMLQQPECAKRRIDFDEARLNVTMHTRPTFAARLDDDIKCTRHRLSDRVRRLHHLSDGGHFATWDFYEQTVFAYVERIHQQHGFEFTHGLGKVRNWADIETFVRDAGLWAFNMTPDSLQ